MARDLCSRVDHRYLQQQRCVQYIQMLLYDPPFLSVVQPSVSKSNTHWTDFGCLLTLTVLDIDWRSVLLPSNDDIVKCRKQRDTAKHGAVPIHGFRRRVCGCGEEAEDEEAEEEAHGDDIAGHAPLAERKARRRDGFAT